MRRSKTPQSGIIGRLVWLLAGGLLILEGCTAAGPRAASQPAPPPENALLIEYIGDQPFVTADAGYRAAYAFWKGGESFAGDYAALSSTLSAGGIISARWNHGADAILDRGAVAFMICRAGDIHGLNWDLTGLGRYAWRELVHRNIARPGSELRLVTGGEFLGILQRAEDYLHEVGRAPAKRVELGDAPPR